MAQINNLAKLEESMVKVEKDDTEITIQKLQNQLLSFKLQMKDFEEHVQQTQKERNEHIEKNNKKIQSIAQMVFSRMTDMHEKNLEIIGDQIDDKVTKDLWNRTENTALDIIEDIKIICNEGASVLND